jgi:NIMA (never in mitosis gene a)-related kinase
MPPEVCLGKPYDFKTDVWAVGIILYELITFKKPYDDNNITLLFKKIVNDPFEPLPKDTDPTL